VVQATQGLAAAIREESGADAGQTNWEAASAVGSAGRWRKGRRTFPSAGGLLPAATRDGFARQVSGAHGLRFGRRQGRSRSWTRLSPAWFADGRQRFGVAERPRICPEQTPSLEASTPARGYVMRLRPTSH